MYNEEPARVSLIPSAVFKWNYTARESLGLVEELSAVQIHHSGLLWWLSGDALQ